MKINIEIVQGNSKIYVEGADTEEILSKLDDIEKIANRVSSLSVVSISVPKSEGTQLQMDFQLAPTEILSQSNAKTALDRIMVLVYYLFKQGTTLVNVNDMSDLFKQVMEPQPRNWGTMMNYISSKGWLTGGQKKDNLKAWSLTRTGLEYVENTLLKSKVVNESQ